MRRILRTIAIVCLAIFPQALPAGEIAGLPPHLVPTVRPDYQLYLGNDFLSTSSGDDFRTQQMMAIARFRERFIATVDLSILTRNNPTSGLPGRIDTMSLSFGYEFIQDDSASRRTTVAAGLGLRSVGDFAGDRIQNGFHRSVNSGLIGTPYVDTRQTDPAAWFFAEHYRVFRPSGGEGFLSDWDLGAWFRSGAFATTDGQLDAVVGGYLVASRPTVDVWIGMRHDWRDGYTADVPQRETAAEEQKLAVNLGARFGPLVIETVQRFDSEASYGQLSFVSSPETRRGPPRTDNRLGFQLGMHLPHMLFQYSFRKPVQWLSSDASEWRESLLFDLRIGQSQLGSDTNRFVETNQFTLDLEGSWPIGERLDWLRFYGGLGAGVRAERLVGRADLSGQGDDREWSAVFVGDLGLEIFAAPIGERWSHSLRFGLTAWLPTGSATSTIGGEPSELMQPGVSIAAAWTIDYR